MSNMYRAWDGKAMTTRGISFNNETGEVVAKTYTQNYGEVSMPLMQCTGVKDSKGRLIFVGDIIDVSGLSKQVIVFDDTPFSTRFSKIHLGNANVYDFGTRISEHCTIIGNVYKNRDLIDGWDLSSYFESW